VGAINYPAMLFSSEAIRSPFVNAQRSQDALRFQPLRRYRSGVLHSFLIVDSSGDRFEGKSVGIQRFAPEYLFRFGVGVGLLGVLDSILTLNPYVSLEFDFQAVRSETLEETKQRIYRYLRLNPDYYTWTSVNALRARVASAKSVEEIVERFVVD
jgi:hypothetical protein